ncbi:unnamed protein product [Caretta caretta]
MKGASWWGKCTGTKQSDNVQYVVHLPKQTGYPVNLSLKETTSPGFTNSLATFQRPSFSTGNRDADTILIT